MKVVFRGEISEVVIVRRSDAQYRIMLVDPVTMEVIVIATKFIDSDEYREYFYPKGMLAFIKDYAENEGVLDVLIANDIVRHAGIGEAPVTIQAGYAELYVVWVNPEVVA